MQQAAALLELTKEQFDGIVALANVGDADALQRLRELLDSSPDLWQRVADLAGHAEAATINLISSGNSLIAESLRRKVEVMRQELQQSGDQLLHKMAVDRLVICWLAMQLAQHRNLDAPAATPLATYWARRQEQGARQYDSAVRSLADVRRLLPASSTLDHDKAVKLAPHTVTPPPSVAAS